MQTILLYAILPKYMRETNKSDIYSYLIYFKSFIYKTVFWLIQQFDLHPVLWNQQNVRVIYSFPAGNQKPDKPVLYYVLSIIIHIYVRKICDNLD
jgi:hypothetical protein